MDIGTFQTRLKALNKDIYIDFKHRSFGTGSKEGTSGIYMRDLKRRVDETGSGLGSIYAKACEAERGADTMIGWTQHGYVPEGDLFNLETGRIIAQGWRTIIKRLIAAGHTTPVKASRVMGYTESFYDRMNYDQKLEYHRKEVV